ncbi:hypothetical protein FHX42_004967 [Saccharopolyspora lacisalsi]|uniref:Uncharacterized protein n=1 Tax=Halosaccharopolyspora lacisalsi TaxID=1000566 RepID=A0A839E8G9_9PSEU|nr:hypothetical protein [Halosaccharopolyspora lacisalsi]MBA8827571.1 hypothetical protein [Halosaccharopolyspora lacisalsi]
MTPPNTGCGVKNKPVDRGDNMHYDNRTFPPRFLQAVFCLLLVASVAGSVAIWVLKGDQLVPAILFTVITVGLFSGLLFMHMRVRVDDEHLVVSIVPVLRRRFALRDVESAELVDSGPREFGGYGMRFGPGGAVGFLMGPGPAVRFTTGSGRIYVVVDANAEEIVRLLR